MNDDLKLVTVLAVSGVAALAAFINGYVLLVILLTKRTSSPINVLLTHLSAVDLIMCIAVLVSILPGTFNEGEQVAPWLCPVHGFLFTFLHPMAIWTVCGLNCDRYYAIAAPLHYGTLVNSRKIMMGLCGTWIVCLLISMPPVFRLVPYTYQPGLPVCTADFSKGRATIFYSIFYTTVTLVLPGVIILGCNIKVFTIARYHRHRIASAIFEVTLSAQVTITHQRNPFFLPTAMANKLRRSNAFSAVFQIIGSLAVFYLPYYAVCLYESLCAALGASPRTDPAVKSLSFALITGSALCNGLLYGIKNKLLKKTYQNYRRKVMTKCEVNQEIQARTPSACGSRRPSLTPVAVNHLQHQHQHLHQHQHQHQHQNQHQHQHQQQQQQSQPGKAPAAAAALSLRRSSAMSLAEPGDFRRHYGPAAAISANGLNFGNYYNTNGAGPSTIRRCYSSSTAAGAECRQHADQSAFVQRIRRESRKSPRILITRAMSEENESYTSEPGTPVRKDLVQKLSSSVITLFIDERRNGASAVRSSRHADYDGDSGGGGGVGGGGGGGGGGDGDDGDDDEDEDEDDRNASPAYSSLSSSNDVSGGGPRECTRLTRYTST